MLVWLLPRHQLLSEKSLLPPTANDVAARARRRTARIMIAWWSVTILTGVIKTANQFYCIIYSAGNSRIDFDGREC